ncbi:unnamed protein product, partial [Ectocarpus sp. 12 AP-2014]
GAADTVYAGETYRIRIRFPANYPIEAPEVVFVPMETQMIQNSLLVRCHLKGVCTGSLGEHCVVIVVSYH